VAGRQYPAVVSVSDFFKSRWLPTPYPATFVDAPGDWRYDRSTLDFISAADGQTTAGLRYRLRALELRPTAAALAAATPAPASVFTPNTALPQNLPASVRKLAESVTAGQESKFEKAVALQQWFRVDGGFRYSLQRSTGNGTDDLVKFLGTGPDSRVGYCEQFAAAMAVMGRTLGIPSRVAVGFLRPKRVADETYVYSSHDLHAWPEMYFGGIGWVRFEPTPQSRASSVPAYTTQQVPHAEPSQSSSAPAAAPSLNRIDRTPDAAAADAGKGSSSSWTGTVLWSTVALLVVIAALALAPRVLRELVRRRRWHAARDTVGLAEAAWAELRDTALDLRLPWDDRLTARTSAAELLRSFGRPGDADGTGRSRLRGQAANPEAATALHRLLELVERARYARRVPAGAATTGQVQADTHACVTAMRAGVGQRRRSRATWFPGSLLAALRSSTRSRSSRGLAVVGEPGVDRVV
jgi:transglutaminase-like putative cysteine protease